ncbi:MAG: pyrimidine 5'-nucleotidase [Methylobacterium mesophilicum]|nr:pyrimidine 5'-nucleotidase [Methylobacterium mesophilicum]
MTHTPPSPDAFDHVNAWVFDLDNTLYPRSANLFAQIDAKMTEYVAELLSLDHGQAKLLQKELYHEHGTTLAGLMARHDVDPDDFLRRVHDLDYSPITAAPALGKAIAALPGRKFIFTNGDRPHAERTAERLGILDQFEGIFDIVAADLLPKPAALAYDRFLTHHGVEGPRAAMFEDLARNLTVPKALGMKTVLVVPPSLEEPFADVWEADRGFTDEVDHVTDDLAGFLKAIAPKNART